MPRMSRLLVLGVLLACAPSSSPSPEPSVQILRLRARLVLAQARFTLRQMGYQVVNPDTDVVVWATATPAGHAIVHCNESLNRRVVMANPVLAIVSAQDTVGGAAVQVRVIGWRPGESPPLALGVGAHSPNGPCLTTGSLERELFSVFRELAQRAAPSN